MTIIRPTRNENITTKILPDGYIVLHNSKTEWAHTLTPLGAIAWELCDGLLTVQEIEQQVVELTERSNDHELKEQVVKLVDEFIALGLVVNRAQEIA